MLLSQLLKSLHGLFQRLLRLVADPAKAVEARSIAVSGGASKCAAGGERGERQKCNAHGEHEIAERKSKAGAFYFWGEGERFFQLRWAAICDVAAQFEATVRTSRGPRIGCAPLMSCR
jgi:hypothetical protein